MAGAIVAVALAAGCTYEFDLGVTPTAAGLGWR